jgi:hypothetical protein
MLNVYIRICQVTRREDVGINSTCSLPLVLHETNVILLFKKNSTVDNTSNFTQVITGGEFRPLQDIFVHVRNIVC